MFAIRSAVNQGIGFTPFEVDGRIVRSPLDFVAEELINTLPRGGGSKIGLVRP